MNRPPVKQKTGGKTEITLLKILLWIYIVLCIIIAGFNYGASNKVSPATAELFTKIWHIYENQVKTLFIAAGIFLTWRVIRRSNGFSMRKNNLIGFLIAALIVHIALPIVLNNNEVYFFTMPLPWTTTPIQLLDTQSGFYLSRAPVRGIGGISAILVFYLIYSMVIFVGTLLFGRRLQCATVCLFNGFVAEVFSPALPLTGRKKRFGQRALRLLTAVKWVFFTLAVFFTVWWILSLTGVVDTAANGTLAAVENYKYLLGELFAAMFFWIVISGRTYCYYCPLGTLLSFLSRAAGQQIKTDNTNCIRCGRCSAACPMTIDVMHSAQDAKPVTNLRCVGCGHCVDTCPTGTLSYSTRFLNGCKRLTQRRRRR